MNATSSMMVLVDGGSAARGMSEPVKPSVEGKYDPEWSLITTEGGVESELVRCPMGFRNGSSKLAVLDANEPKEMSELRTLLRS